MIKERTMRRVCLAILILIAPGLLVLTVSGCEEKTVTVQQSEGRHTSEPEMVAPGTDTVVE